VTDGHHLIASTTLTYSITQ